MSAIFYSHRRVYLNIIVHLCIFMPLVCFSELTLILINSTIL
ncbi:hypothetical protein A1OE_462 [Candidatus Endolissoclinum faulkneri L2]|uniref:Uncharacterized protein n=1 Tax=Candidatus Endolissoclinum faulkneri L2 TaxID=1193729 RepID=K7YGB9_9PROT|nr:hypothetical protein A1OE_462 [Candidatus Endolissoclinum faulkneri L2]